jgi:hypothetical protein
VKTSLIEDYKDMLSALDDVGAEYLIVGAYALAGHGNPRATGDIDIWVRPTAENAERVWQAIEKYGAPRRMMKKEDFCDTETVFQIGVAPYRIDIITSISGVEFEEAWPAKSEVDYDGYKVNVLGLRHLLANKQAAGRPKDLADVAWIKKKIKQ